MSEIIRLTLSEKNIIGQAVAGSEVGTTLVLIHSPKYSDTSKKVYLIGIMRANLHQIIDDYYDFEIYAPDIPAGDHKRMEANQFIMPQGWSSNDLIVASLNIGKPLISDLSQLTGSDIVRSDGGISSNRDFCLIQNSSTETSNGRVFLFGFNNAKRDFFASRFWGCDVYCSNRTTPEQIATGIDFFIYPNGLQTNDRFVVWGRKDPKHITEFCSEHKISLERIEDGFIRSIELGGLHGTPLSYVIDSKGIYFDSTQESDIENTLNTYDFSTNKKLMERARNNIKRIVENSFSKYNFRGDASSLSDIISDQRRKILVVGQVENDASIEYGSEIKLTNSDLVLRVALENPDAMIIYKPHPDVLAGLRSIESDPYQFSEFVYILDTPMPVTYVFDLVDEVHTITSLAGFEALLRGKKVVTYGAPFYSNWGLTDDRQIVERRKRSLTIEEVFAAAYILYPTYLNPYTEKEVEIEEALDLLQWMISTGYSPSPKALPSSARVLIKRAKKEFDDGNFQTALSWINQSIRCEETEESLLLRARISIAAGKVGPAVKRDFENACKLSNWATIAPLMNYAKYKWEFEGPSKSLRNILDLLKNKKLTFDQREVYAAMRADLFDFTHVRSSLLILEKQSKGEFRIGNTLLAATAEMIDPGYWEYHGTDPQKIIDHVKDNMRIFEQKVRDAGRGVCLVGNSPCETGTGNGAIIDEMDFVIRFNRFANTESEFADYGRKRDVWVRMPRNFQIPNELSLNSCLTVISGIDPISRFSDSQFILSYLMKENENITVIPPGIYREVATKIGASPSAGLMLLYWVRALIGPLRREQAFGFNLTDQPKGRDFQRGSSMVNVSRHNWEKERLLFDSLFS